jgi:hypothetical protein
MSQGSGCQKSGVSTPITVYGSLFTMKVLPMTCASAPKRQHRAFFLRALQHLRQYRRIRRGGGADSGRTNPSLIAAGRLDS